MNQRDLLLVPFPFSDQSGRRVRPVIVISNNSFNEYSDDVLVVGVTSNISKDKYTLSFTDRDIEDGRLFTKCCIKIENLLKIDKELVIKKIGRIKKDTLNKISNKIMDILRE